MPTFREAAEKLWEEVEFAGQMHHRTAVNILCEDFDEDFVFSDEKGSVRIDQRVLNEFNALHEGKVFYISRRLTWYLVSEHDDLYEDWQEEQHARRERRAKLRDEA